MGSGGGFPDSSSIGASDPLLNVTHSTLLKSNQQIGVCWKVLEEGHSLLVSVKLLSETDEPTCASCPEERTSSPVI